MHPLIRTQSELQQPNREETVSTWHQSPSAQEKGTAEAAWLANRAYLLDMRLIRTTLLPTLKAADISAC